MQQNKNTVLQTQIVVTKLEYKGLVGVRRQRSVKESVIDAQVARLIKKYDCENEAALVALVDGYTSAAQMRADLRQAKVLQYAAIEETALQERLLEQVACKMQADIPQALIDQKVQAAFVQAQEGYRAQGTTLDAYLALIKQTVEAFRAELVQKETLAVRKEIALREIASAEQVQITPEEVQVEYQAIADHRGTDLAQAKKGLTEPTVVYALTVRKVKSLLVQYAQVTTEEI